MGITHTIKSFFTRPSAPSIPTQKTIPDRIIPTGGWQYFSQGPLILPYPVDVASIEVMVNHSPVLSAIVTNLRNEVFRRPPEMKDKFTCKCVTCLHEFEKEYESCPDCGGETRPPDKLQKMVYDKFCMEKNTIGMTFRELCEIVEDDLNRFDDAYIITRYDYAVDNAGDILAKRFVEVVRGIPARMRIIKDERAVLGGESIGIENQGFYTCVLHRIDNIQSQDGDCKLCGRKLHKALYIALDQQGREDIGYIDGEVLHVSKYRPSDSYGFSPVLCYDDQTEVLTAEGWKLFKNVTYQDEIATLKDGEELVYEKPNKIIEYDYNGKMYRLQTQKVDIKVNPEHRLYIKTGNTGYHIRPANESFGLRAKHKKGAVWSKEDAEYFTLPGIMKTRTHVFASGDRHHKNQEYKNTTEWCPEIQIKMDDWVEFLGYYLSEGSTTGDYRDKKYQVKIAQSQSAHPKKFNKMEKCLQRLPFECHRNSDGMGFSIYSLQLASHLRKYGHAEDKYVDSNILMELSSRQHRIMLDALMLGDGHYNSYATISSRLADCVQEIALKCGLSADIRTYSPQKQNYHQCYHVTIHGLFSRNGGETTVNKNQYDDEWVDYKGKIHCVNVPNNIIYIRRNGKTVWCGNSTWTEAKTLINISRLASMLYEQHRPPKGLLVFRTKNVEAIQAQFADIDEKMKTNPLYIPKLAVESEGGERFAEWMPITPTQEELQTLELMKEMRERIEAVYGVSNILMADSSSSGGLNNEGLQLTVTMRTIERAQQLWEVKIFPAILLSMGITDYRLKFPPPVEKDRMAVIERRARNLQLIQQVMSMGAKTEMTNSEDFEFNLKGGFAVSPTPSPMASPPGETPKAYSPEQKVPSGHDVIEVSIPPIESAHNYSLTNNNKNNNASYTYDIMEKQRADVHFTRHLKKIFSDMLDDIKLPSKPIPREIVDRVNKVISDARTRWETAILSDYAELINRGIAETGLDPASLGMDMNALALLASKESPLWNTYTDMSMELSRELNRIITDAFSVPGMFDMRKIRNAMKDVATDIIKSRLETIARTETTAIVNKGRELAWTTDDDGQRLYKFLHYDDFRFCPTCREIVEMVGEGKPMAVIRGIIKEVTLREMGTSWKHRDWVVHPNCRGKLVRLARVR